MELNKEEIDFLIECLEWNKLNYSEKASRNNDIKGYQEKISLPKIKKMEDMINRLKVEKTRFKS